MSKDTKILVKQGKQEEKGIWKSYFNLMFKAKLPWGWLIFAILAFMASSTVTLIFPQYIQKVYEGVLKKEVIYGAITVLLVGIIINGIVRYFTKLLMYKIDVSYRSLIWEKLMLSPLSLYNKVKPTEMVSRVTNDAATISQVLGSWVPTIISSMYYTVVTIAILFTYDWRLGLSVFIYVPIYILFNMYYGKWNYRVNKLTFNRLSELTQFLSELLMNIPLIKTFVTETKEEQRGKAYLQSYYKASFKRAIINWIENPINGILSITQEILVIVFGIYLVKTGAITIAQWIGFFMYVGMLWPALTIFIIAYTDIKRSQGATSRIGELINGPLEEFEGKTPITDLDGDLVFDQLSFSYKKNKEVLTDLQFTIPKGKVTAIVGPSGSGKSTVFSLLQQFYQPDSGQILVDGEHPIIDYNLKDWRSLFSYVAQDSPLISGSILENIVYGVDRKVSQEEIDRAAEAANALTFIREFPEGYHTDVGEGGANLSGGQRQRVAIARAILRDAPILLFDEATASLDSQSEKLVQEAMEKLIENRTTIMIAHDLSTIRDADQIVLLDSGKVDGIGTHEHLMKTNELYRLFVSLHKSA